MDLTITDTHICLQIQKYKQTQLYLDKSARSAYATGTQRICTAVHPLEFYRGVKALVYYYNYRVNFP